MNSILLLNGLPFEYEGIAISADFRNMIQVDMIMHDEEGDEFEKTMKSLEMLYEELPSDICKAMEGLVWFYSRGKISCDEEAKEALDTQEPANRAFSFKQDAELIYAAFYATYKINLATIQFLHWWEFMALFEGLPDDTLIKRIIYWRTADTTDMPKVEKAHIQKMRKLFALEETSKKPMSATDINKQTKDRVAKRFEQAKKAQELNTV